jgi:hypothetical protein
VPGTDVPAPPLAEATTQRMESEGNRPTEIGRSAPVGATVICGGVNFSLYSRDASGIELLLFDHADDSKAARVITLDPSINRTHHYWHVFAPGIRAGQLYGYRVHGAFDPGKGLRFDAAKVLLDPYSRSVAVPKNYSREAAQGKGDTATTAYEKCGRRSNVVRLGRRHADSPTVFSVNRLRNACQGVYQASHFGCPRGDARHFSWTHREDSISSGLGHLGRRTSSRIPVRSPRLPARSRQLLGLCTTLFLRAAPCV